jgi:hypothetical protein
VPLTVELEPSQITMEAGSTLDLSAIVFDGSGSRIIGPAIQWQVSAGAGSISAEGVLTAGTQAGTQAGSFSGAIQLMAKQGTPTGEATFDMTIEPGHLDNVEVLPAEAILSRDESVQFRIVGSDSYGNPISGLEVSWKAGDSLVIDESGLVTATQRVAAPPLPGPIGWWPGNGNAEDLTEMHDGGPSVGIGYSPGVFGQGFRLDGTDDLVEVQGSGQLNLRGNVTAHLWAKGEIFGVPSVLLIKGAGVKANIDGPTVFILKFGSRGSPVGDGDYHGEALNVPTAPTPPPPFW